MPTLAILLVGLLLVGGGVAAGVYLVGPTASLEHVAEVEVDAAAKPDPEPQRPRADENVGGASGGPRLENVAVAQTKLRDSVRRGDPDAVRAALADGADPNHYYLEDLIATASYTALWSVPSAPPELRAAVVDALVDGGADVEARQLLNTPREETMLMMLVASRALTHLDENQLLPLARFLVEKGANVNAVRPDGCTGLHLVAFGTSARGVFEAAEFLGGLGADFDLRNDRGERPIDVLKVERGPFEEIMRRHGFDPADRGD